MFVPCAVEAASEPVIGGSAPMQRPVSAPVITKIKHNAAWRAQALHGVSSPYPDSVSGFLDDQGNWYSPFLHAGMTGLYDLRGWNAAKKQRP